MFPSKAFSNKRRLEISNRLLLRFVLWFENEGNDKRKENGSRNSGKPPLPLRSRPQTGPFPALLWLPVCQQVSKTDNRYGRPCSRPFHQWAIDAGRCEATPATTKETRIRAGVSFVLSINICPTAQISPPMRNALTIHLSFLLCLFAQLYQVRNPWNKLFLLDARGAKQGARCNK